MTLPLGTLGIAFDSHPSSTASCAAYYAANYAAYCTASYGTIRGFE